MQKLHQSKAWIHHSHFVPPQGVATVTFQHKGVATALSQHKGMAMLVFVLLHSGSARV